MKRTHKPSVPMRVLPLSALRRGFSFARLELAMVLLVKEFEDPGLPATNGFVPNRNERVSQMVIRYQEKVRHIDAL